MLQTLTRWAARNLDPPPSRETLRRWVRDGRIPGARKIGRDWYVPADSLPTEPDEDYSPSDTARRIAGCA